MVPRIKHYKAVAQETSYLVHFTISVVIGAKFYFIITNHRRRRRYKHLVSVSDEMLLDIVPADGVRLGPETVVEREWLEDFGDALLAVVAQALVVLQQADLRFLGVGLVVVVVAHLVRHVHLVGSHLGHAT